MVRTSFINEINNVITASGFFDTNDFDVSTKEDSKHYALSVTYKYDRRYWFAASIPKNSADKYEIPITSVPGEINEKENTTASGRYGLSSSISDWLKRLIEELQSIPIYRQLNEQKLELEEKFKRLQNLEEVAFTREEADGIKADLDKLREQVIEHIRAGEASKAEQDKKIQEINNDVDALKVSVETLNKPNWARAAITRFYRWTKDTENRGLLKDGVEVAAKLLGGNVDSK